LRTPDGVFIAVLAWLGPIGFTTITDGSVTGDGWFLDKVTAPACTP